MIDSNAEARLIVTHVLGHGDLNEWDEANVVEVARRLDIVRDEGRTEMREQIASRLRRDRTWRSLVAAIEELPLRWL